MQKRIDRLIDEALLLAATQAGVLYVHRRTRRALPRLALGTAVLAGVGAAAATAAATAGVVGLAAGGAAWYRKRERSRAGTDEAATGAPAAAVTPNMGGGLPKERSSSERASAH
ncbi:MAG: hypothetical protein FWD42_02180 [Solirubrobacterales bacterium]|nr:hypothetical protein [Solirubrobacterales bacterium]